MTVQESTAAGTRAELIGLGRAAGELELSARQFELAVQLGLVAMVRAPGASRGRRVPRSEIDRLRAEPGFPSALRARLHVVGTAQGAQLMGISKARFTLLAKAGCFDPVRFYVNRYRAVVWLYLAGELEAFAEREPGLLRGRYPQGIRALVEDGGDWRAHNWRLRRVGQLLGQTEDPWERAAVSAAVLAEEQLAEVVPLAHERVCLDRLRPELVSTRGASEAAREVTRRVLVADRPDEVLWHRLSLAMALDEARDAEAAPAYEAGPCVAHGRGLRGWLSRRRRGSTRPGGGRPQGA